MKSLGCAHECVAEFAREPLLDKGVVRATNLKKAKSVDDGKEGYWCDTLDNVKETQSFRCHA